MAATARPVAWGPIAAAMLLGAAVAGIAAWNIGLRAVAGQVAQKRADLKKLAVTGRVPPNEDVSRYLKSRQDKIDAQYQYWLDRVAAPPMTAAAAADPQLFFQEQVHGLQRTLERLATARNAKTPEQLGFPKELPPTDTVPRLLAQLAVLESVAELAYERGITDVASLKIEDPEPLPESEGFITRVPVRARLTASLPQIMDLLAALQRQKPLIDVTSVRLTRPDAGPLDAELVLTRYLVAQGAPPPARAEAQPRGNARGSAKPAGRRP